MTAPQSSTPSSYARLRRRGPLEGALRALVLLLGAVLSGVSFGASATGPVAGAALGGRITFVGAVVTPTWSTPESSASAAPAVPVAESTPDRLCAELDRAPQGDARHQMATELRERAASGIRVPVTTITYR